MSAHADVGAKSEASAKFLSGSLLDLLDLDSVAGIDGPSATFIEGVSTPPSVKDTEGLEVEALSLIDLDLGPGVALPLDDHQAAICSKGQRHLVHYSCILSIHLALCCLLSLSHFL